MSTQELLNLSKSERILLAEKLWDSVAKDSIELSDTITKELDYRLNRLKNEETKFYTWQDIKNELKEVRK
jgi:putative addiction module component (TIGR02574 family)